jgi:hypothetical protein
MGINKTECAECPHCHSMIVLEGFIPSICPDCGCFMDLDQLVLQKGNSPSKGPAMTKLER